MPSFWNMTNLNPIVLNFYEDTTHGSFKSGDLVKLHTNGKVRLATANGAVLGIAHRNATGTADSIIPVELLNSVDVYVGTHGGTSALTDLGDVVDATMTYGAQTVDNDSAAATTDFVVVGLYDAAAAGGRVMLRILGGGNLDNKNVK